VIDPTSPQRQQHSQGPQGPTTAGQDKFSLDALLYESQRQELQRQATQNPALNGADPARRYQRDG
jgi:hypothetical protein